MYLKDENYDIFLTIQKHYTFFYLFLSKTLIFMVVENKKLIYALIFPCLFVFFLWIFLLLEKGLGYDWHNWGIFPRSVDGIKGILTSPLVHSGVSHLFNNSIPLIVLGWCLFYFYKELSFIVLPIIWILSGVLTWCIGRDSWHIGASGLIYALSFFLFFSGLFRKYIPLMAVSLLVAFLYGSTLWNMFPIAEIVDSSISWEGHLSGAISGLFAAIIFRKQGPQKPEDDYEDDEDEDSDENLEDEIINPPILPSQK
ncbi:membrane associated rhomboid family serine protease [Dysgonomonadaceae bacterium PH5-43]|nr:membrane associated rhomboid family serine protease [Dysgonomonadaceae bacterium PH5-43]